MRGTRRLGLRRQRAGARARRCRSAALPRGAGRALLVHAGRAPFALPASRESSAPAGLPRRVDHAPQITSVGDEDLVLLVVGAKDGYVGEIAGPPIVEARLEADCGSRSSPRRGRRTRGRIIAASAVARLPTAVGRPRRRRRSCRRGLPSQRPERGALVEADVAGQERHRVRELGHDHVEQRRADASMNADRVQQEEDAEPSGDPGHDEDQPGPENDALRGRGAGQERAVPSGRRWPTRWCKSERARRRGPDSGRPTSIVTSASSEPAGRRRRRRRRARRRPSRAGGRKQAPARAREPGPARAGGNLQHGDLRCLARAPGRTVSRNEPTELAAYIARKPTDERTVDVQASARSGCRQRRSRARRAGSASPESQQPGTPRPRAPPSAARSRSSRPRLRRLPAARPHLHLHGIGNSPSPGQPLEGCTRAGAEGGVESGRMRGAQDNARIGRPPTRYQRSPSRKIVQMSLLDSSGAGITDPADPDRALDWLDDAESFLLDRGC